MLALVLSTWVAVASAATPTVDSWAAELGPPSRPAALADRTRGADEPLLVYWMQVQAAPLGLGPALPGTLVANFDAATPLGDSSLRDFTFLAVASPEQTAQLEAALRQAGWVQGEQTEDRPGGTFRDLQLRLPDGRSGTLSLRQGAATGAMADGRPSPSMWLHVGQDQG